MLKVIVLILLIIIYCGCSKDEPFVEKSFVGTVYLMSQQEVNAFADSSYTDVDGSIIIGKYHESSDITDLSRLNTLRHVQHLTICNNDGLTTLNGLHRLKAIYGSIEIKGNKNLTSLSGL